MREIPFMVRNKYFTAIQQVASLKSAYKFNNSRWILRHHGFTWFFDVTPTPISDTYKLKIVYNEIFYPLVYVVSPKPLALAKGATKLPHTYDSKKQHLCLFNPHCGEWSSPGWTAGAHRAAGPGRSADDDPHLERRKRAGLRP